MNAIVQYFFFLVLRTAYGQSLAIKIFSSQGNRHKALTGRRKGLCKNLTQGKEASHVRQILRKRKRMNELRNLRKAYVEKLRACEISLMVVNTRYTMI